MGDHRGEPCALRHGNRIQGLGQCADLIELDQDGIRDPFSNSPCEPFRVRHEQIISDDLYLVPEAVGHLLPAFPVVLRMPVLDAQDRIFLDQSLVVVHHLRGRQRLPLGLQLVSLLFCVVKLTRCRVESQKDVHARLVSGLLDRLHDHGQGLFVASQVRRKPTFIPDGGGVSLLLQDILQTVKDLCPHPQGLSKALRTDREDHELLEIHVVVRVLAPVQHVHHRHGQQLGVGPPHVSIERKVDTLCNRLGNGQRNPENSVRPEVVLVLAPVQGDHPLIDPDLVGASCAQKSGRDLLVHVRNRLLNPLAQVPFHIPVSQLDGLVFSRGGPRRNRCPAQRAALQNNIDLHGGVPTRIQNLSCRDGFYTVHTRSPLVCRFYPG